MRNMNKQSIEGKRRIPSENYDLTISEVMQLLEIVKENKNGDGLLDAITTAFYAGVNVGHRIAVREMEKREKV